MASWTEVTAAAPELAAAARELLDAHVHKTLATLRRDGSPRISGIEARFTDDDLWFGSMWQARKALDLRHDPRFALHSASEDPPRWRGDAKVAGRAVEITDAALIEALGGGHGAPPGPSHLFKADVQELVLTRLGEPADHIVIEWWREGVGVRRMERR